MKDKRGKFILLGNTRIKIGNIKDYGISSKMKDYEKIYEVVERSGGIVLKFLLGNIKLVWNGEVEKITADRWNELSESSKHSQEVRNEHVRYWYEYTYKRYKNEKGEVVTANDLGAVATLENSVVEKEIKYLYITTFQNDNFRFYEDEVDFSIIDKCNELDSLLCI